MKMKSDLIALIEENIEQGLIRKRKHPNRDLWILNYSNRAARGWIWNEATKICRGLIVDSDWNIIEQPLEKFFDYNNEQTNGFRLFDKMDGSMGIIYKDGDSYAVATRGSFDSPQALEATAILQERYSNVEFNPEYTYVVEIIYPKDQKVVNYRGARDLFLIAVLKGGKDVEADVPLPKVQEFDPSMYVVDRIGQEGYVMLASDGTRYKLKQRDYVRSHKFLFNMCLKSLFRLYDDGILNLSIDNLPPISRERAKKIVGIVSEYQEKIFNESKNDLDSLVYTEKAPQAREILTKRYPHVIFAMRDDKDVAKAIRAAIMKDQAFVDEINAKIRQEIHNAGEPDGNNSTL